MSLKEAPTKELQCIHRAGCHKPEVCGKVGHCTSMTAEECLNMAKLENDSECTVMPPVSGKTLLEIAVEERNRPSNRKSVPEQFGRLYADNLPFGGVTGTWVRRAEVDALLDDIERLQRELQGVRLGAEGMGWAPRLPDETTAVDPFDHAAIMADPGNRRISMRFETQEQYEAALTFLDMADGPEDVTLNNIAVKCSQCQYAGVAAKWGGQCPVCHAKL